MIKRLLAVVAAALGVLVFTATAGAATLGITTAPDGSTAGTCAGAVIGQLTDDPSTPYIIPAGGGAITEWQTDAAGDDPGSDLTLAVLQPSDDGAYSVVGTDTEVLPDTFPEDGVVGFTLPQPIIVSGGDTLALYSSDNYDACYFNGGSTPSGDGLFIADPVTGTLPPTTGEAFEEGDASGGGFTLDLAVTLDQTTADAGVQTSTFPASATAGNTAILSSVVSNAGPVTDTVTFVDQVPAGLQIQSAVTGLGTCSVSGQTVTCTITGLPSGQSVPVEVVVTPSVAGAYTNNVSVADPSGWTDPNAANNSASSTLEVVAAPQTQTAAQARQCIVPRLPRIQLAAARTLLKELGCTVHVSEKHSRVAKGTVIGLEGKTGTYSYRHVVTLVVSSGSKPKHKKHKHAARSRRR